MAIKVTTGNNTVVQTVTAGNTTIVKKVKIGTPVRRVTPQGTSIFNLAGIDVTLLGDGALLIYNESTSKFEAKQELDNINTDLNGGNF